MPPFTLFLAGLVAGAGAVAAFPRLSPWLQEVRPAFKAGLKVAIAAVEDARAAAAELAETAEDLYAEAAAEVAAERISPRRSDAKPTTRRGKSQATRKRSARHPPRRHVAAE